jgi:Fungal specific transcription factor domain
MGLSGVLNACPEQAHQNYHASKLIHTCRQYLIYHLVMARATFRSDSIIPNLKSTLSRCLGYGNLTTDSSGINNYTRRSPEPNQPSTSCNPNFISIGAPEDMNLIDPYQGFSNTLLLVINDICNLVDLRSTPEPEDRARFTWRVSQLENSLQNLVQLPPIYLEQQMTNQNIAHDEMSPSEQYSQGLLESLVATAEANRLATFLFLDEACALHLPEVIPNCRKDRSENIKKILSLVEGICNEQAVTAALPIWPVFMAGCCTGEENRVRILNILDMFQGQRIFGVS